MEENTTIPKPQKRNGCLKIFLIILLSFFCFFIFIGIISSLFDGKKSDGTNKKRIEFLKKDSINRENKFKNGWSSVPDSIKKKEIDAFINSDKTFYKEKRFLLNENIIEIIKLSAKYPETVEYKAINGEFTKNPTGYTMIKPSDFSNVNYDKGMFDVSKDFKSENKLGMKVNGRIITSISFNGLKYTIKDVKFD